MLLQFRFQNFKSFRDDTILDLTATKISENQDHVTIIGGEKVLPVAAVYGANASGKSNVIEAFTFMGYYVQRSFAFGGEKPYEKQSSILRPQGKPFAFDKESSSGEALFEVNFTDGVEGRIKIYNYGFTLNQKGVVEEWLNVKSKSSSAFKTVFYRGPEELDLSGIDKKRRENLSVSLEKETLIVSLGAKLKVDICKRIFDWFSDQNIADFGTPAMSYRLSRIIPEDFDTDEKVRKDVVDYLAAFDASIVGFRVEKSENYAPDNDQYNIWTIHRIVGTNETTSIPMSEESSGTLKMFSLYPIIQDTLEHGSVLFVDEFNARLHPLLMRIILIMFLNPEKNKHHAQLVFTTHDTFHMSDHLFRRDEIWFTEKNADGVSVLYSLADFVDEDGDKIRKDENYEKNYLMGKYGAIPTLKYLFD